MGTQRLRTDGTNPRYHDANSNDRIPSKRHKRVPVSTHRSSNIPPINPLKSKIRNLTRALDHGEHLPPGVRIEKERALAGYKRDLEDAQEAKRKQDFIGRYHMVRFFERQKATRHLKKARKRLSVCQPTTSEHAQALEDVHIAEVDLNYTQYCPLNSKYEGLYHRGDSQTAREHGNGGEAKAALASRPAMWRVVENCMRDGTLEALREGKMTSTFTVGRKKPPENQARGGSGGGVDSGSKSKAAEARQRDKMDDDDNSDGGFFEE